MSLLRRCSAAPVTCLSLLILAVLGGPAVASERLTVVMDHDPPTSEKMKAWEAEQLANAQPVSLVSPFYCIVDSVESDLYLVNVFSQPIEIDVTAFSEHGESLSLGTLELQPTRHRSIPLSQKLRQAGESFEAGSLRIDLTGNVQMLEAWIVMRSGETAGEQFIEWPFTRLGEHQSQRVDSFWDTRLLGRDVKPTYRLLNSADHPVTYDLRLGQGSRTVHSETLTIDANSVQKVSPRDLHRSLSHGWLKIEHQGPADALSAVGWLGLGPPGQSPFLSGLPVTTDTSPALPVEFHSLRLPLRSADKGLAAASGRLQDAAVQPNRAVLSLYNSSDIEQSIEVSLLAMTSGLELVSTALDVHPGRIVGFDLGEFLRKREGFTLDTLGPEDVRLRIRGGNDTLRLWASGITPSREFLDISMMRDTEAHPGGLYALPKLADFEIVNTLINLGDEQADVRGQIFWEGGTYTLPPIHIPAGNAHRLDIAELARENVPDLLGRTLDPDYAHGYLQWTTHLGSYEIIDRLELQSKSGASKDLFGFQYNTCCPDDSIGDLIPGTAIVDFGQTGSFVTSEFIVTCSGLLGPYQTFGSLLTYSSPASWNGSTVSSSTDTSQMASFMDYGQEIINHGQDGCIPEIVQFGDDGPIFADRCREEHHDDPDFDPSMACAVQSTSCSDCYSCCEKEKKVGQCRCPGGANLCKTLARLACGTCKSECFGTTSLNCTTQATTCS